MDSSEENSSLEDSAEDGSDGVESLWCWDDSGTEDSSGSDVEDASGSEEGCMDESAGESASLEGARLEETVELVLPPPQEASIAKVIVDNIVTILFITIVLLRPFDYLILVSIGL